MDSRTFEAELSKYRIVRSSTWRGEMPRSADAVRASAAAAPTAPVLSPVGSKSTGTNAHSAAVSAPLLQQGDGLDLMESLRRVLDGALKDRQPQVDLDRVMDAFRDDLEATIESLSLDDIEGVACRMSVAEAL
jgi:hypothetical protein